MTARSLIDRIVQQEHINFFLTNRIPRRRLTQLMGRLSRIEQPWLCAIGIFLWRLFSDLDLGEAEETHFKSLHACFTRRLKQGARPVDDDAAHLTSPCDALVGACGRIAEGTVLQAKGSPYLLAELLCDADLAHYYRGGEFVTLRLTSSMYHRFHAPYDCRVEQIDYISGDTWNVNPIALKRSGLRCLVSVAAIEASTAMRTATPLFTCSRMTERGPSATSEEISTPRFMGPGCITSTLDEASFTRFASRPKSGNRRRRRARRFAPCAPSGCAAS
jgi:hypothetical protein